MSSPKELVQVDVIALNALAAGAHKKTPRIVAAGVGGKLMGTKSIIDVTAEEITQDSETFFEKDEKERRKYSRQRHISDQPWTLQNWHEHINWLNVILVILIPMVGMVYAFFHAPQMKTLALGGLLYICSGLSITAGYHRLFSHNSYVAHWSVRAFYAFFGAGAVQGSIKWWSHYHRLHHRYSDTNRDPHDARNGFWYSHMGWMLLKANPKNRARADISDLTSDPIVVFQHKHYLALMLFSGIILPCLVAGIGWGDYMGGFFYAGILKIFVIQQATFCVNSLAHWIGAQPFDDRRTASDHVLTALVTFGEGYHNFHHEFPSDYRNVMKWYQYDPTKALILAFSKLGLVWNLKTFSQNAIEQGLYQQQLKKLVRQKKQLNWGTPVQNLPVWDRLYFNEIAKQEGLIIISGIVHNVKSFMKEHPGGEILIKASLGQDATKAFNGHVYAHSNAAHNLLATMRVAVIKDVEVNEDTFDLQEHMMAKKDL